MHNNYYFLRQLTQALQRQLVGSVIDSCFSQEKDELVISFSRSIPLSHFFIKAMLTAQFSALYFPDNFNRARANSVNLFPEIIGEEVLDMVQHQNERSFYLTLSNQKALLFKLFGNLLFTRKTIISQTVIFFEANESPQKFAERLYSKPDSVR